MTPPKDLTLNMIKVGDTASFERAFSDDDVRTFARLSGDENPLHLDDTYAKTTKFGRRIVHGMLLGGLCSALVGMYLPGKRCLYLGQTLTFKKPVFIGDLVTVSGTVVSISASTRIVEIEISMRTKDGEVASGTATVQVLG